MVIAQICYGLGNQLFQYAAARRLAHIHQTELKLDVRFYAEGGGAIFGLTHFNIHAAIASRRDIFTVSPLEALPAAVRFLLPAPISQFAIEKLNKTPLRSRYYHRMRDYEPDRPFPPLILGRIVSERFYHFDPEVLSAPDNVCLTGYWQSEKYFKDISATIREELTVKEPLSGRNLEVAREIEASNSVSLHVRRGDKVNHPLFPSTSAEYCAQALTLLTGKLTDPTFFIFSDDWPWVRANLPAGAQVRHVDHNGAADYEDLRLISLCKHNIIGPSSFSWWGAWLNNNPQKIVIAPADWIRIPNHTIKDVYPEDWIVI
jgi:hypothetical protein